jgi:hypothetical protein
MRRGRVLHNIAVGNNAPQNAFLGVPVAVHEPRNEDHIRSIDYIARSRETGRNRRDLFPLDQQVALHEVSNLRIHADNGAALQQNFVIGIRIPARDPIHDFGIFGLRKGRALCRGGSQNRGGVFEEATPRTARGTLHFNFHEDPGFNSSELRVLKIPSNPARTLPM